MQQFRNILFVTNAIGNDINGLQQTLQLACNNKAKLSVLIVCPSLPKKLQDYQRSYEESLIDKINKEIQTAKSNINIDNKKLAVNIDFIFGDTLSIQITRYILKHSHDLLIKKVEGDNEAKGFRSLDFELLRKAPCGILLFRDKNYKHKKQRVAVAIDPQEEKKVGHDLSIHLLKVAYSLAEYYTEPLDIISSWIFGMENYLRDNVWIRIPEDELDKLVADEKTVQYNALQDLIQKSRIGDKYQIDLVKGYPDTTIPLMIAEKNIDILVMGTVARTGISGFIIGNTAENILQEVSCSLLALKPKGFVSPVTL